MPAMSLVIIISSIAIGLILLSFIVFKVIGVRVIGNDKIGIVERWWSFQGSLKDGIIALNKESGFLPDVLRGGIHIKPGFRFKVHIYPLITIPQGQMAYIFARSGNVLPNSQLLGKAIPESNNFQDVRGFLDNGGHKGPQRGILREGTYALNLAQFVIITRDNIYYLPLGDKMEESMFKNMQNDIHSRNGFQPIIIKGNANFSQIIDSDAATLRKDKAKEASGTYSNSDSSNNQNNDSKYSILNDIAFDNVSGTNIKRDLIGIVTVQDGLSLPNGEIIAPVVGTDKDCINTYHNNFQNPDNFLLAGGYKGRQEQVLTDGTYYINRLFATVEFVPKTLVPVGFVGVVVSYTGKKGDDMSGESYKHGELVKQGCKGVWEEPLMPGKYAFNIFAGEVKLVPTTNIILKWQTGIVGAHKYDENLKEVDLITKDAFQPSLPLSVVLHIDYKKAPFVIQRFGDMEKLVNQTLDPLIASYFKNIGQTYTLLEIVHKRSEIQRLSTQDMQEKFRHYNLELEEVLIGTPQSSHNDKQMDIVLEQLRQRQVAEEQVKTFESQQKAADKKRNLKESEAIAEQQASLTQSDIDIRIQTNKGLADAKKAEQEAIKIKALALAEADKVRTIGMAEADRIRSIGEAEAIAIQKQVDAYGGAQYQLIEKVMSKFSEAILNAKIDIVPKTVVSMGNSEGKSMPNAFESLLGVILSEKFGVRFNQEEKAAPFIVSEPQPLPIESINTVEKTETTLNGEHFEKNTEQAL